MNVVHGICWKQKLWVINSVVLTSSGGWKTSKFDHILHEFTAQNLLVRDLIDGMLTYFQ